MPSLFWLWSPSAKVQREDKGAPVKACPGSKVFRVVMVSLIH